MICLKSAFHLWAVPGIIRLINKHFESCNLKLKFCLNTIKLRYSCRANMTTNITSHDRDILLEDVQPNNCKKCHCKRKQMCPLNQNSKIKLMYNATMTKENRANDNESPQATSSKSKSKPLKPVMAVQAEAEFKIRFDHH